VVSVACQIIKRAARRVSGSRVEADDDDNDEDEETNSLCGGAVRPDGDRASPRGSSRRQRQSAGRST